MSGSQSVMCNNITDLASKYNIARHKLNRTQIYEVVDVPTSVATIASVIRELIEMKHDYWLNHNINNNIVMTKDEIDFMINVICVD